MRRSVHTSVLRGIDIGQKLLNYTAFCVKRELTRQNLLPHCRQSHETSVRHVCPKITFLSVRVDEARYAARLLDRLDVVCGR